LRNSLYEEQKRWRRLRWLLLGQRSGVTPGPTTSLRYCFHATRPADVTSLNSACYRALASVSAIEWQTVA
jgi:hypothetical protein